MFRVALDDALALRLLEPRHAPELYALVDANRAHLGPWFPWVEGSRSPDDTRAFIQRGLRELATGEGFQCGVEQDGQLVGCLGVHDVRPKPGTCEIGFWLAGEAEGRGLITRAVVGLLPWLFRDMDLRRVAIRALPENRRSRAVAERLGFRQEGVLRRIFERDGATHDIVVYGLLREEWAAGRVEAALAEGGR